MGLSMIILKLTKTKPVSDFMLPLLPVSGTKPSLLQPAFI